MIVRLLALTETEVTIERILSNYMQVHVRFSESQQPVFQFKALQLPCRCHTTAAPTDDIIYQIQYTK